MAAALPSTSTGVATSASSFYNQPHTIQPCSSPWSNSSARSSASSRSSCVAEARLTPSPGHIPFQQHVEDARAVIEAVDTGPVVGYSVSRAGAVCSSRWPLMMYTATSEFCDVLRCFVRTGRAPGARCSAPPSVTLSSQEDGTNSQILERLARNARLAWLDLTHAAGKRTNGCWRTRQNDNTKDRNMWRDRTMGRDWHQLAVESHYRTAMGVKEALEEGDLDGALRGIDELIDAMGRSDRRAVRSQLIRLMQHIIKMARPERRSPSWAATIAHARDEIVDTQEETPSITDDMLRQMWEHCFQRAKRYAERETGRSIPSQTLSWHDVFEADYPLPEERA